MNKPPRYGMLSPALHGRHVIGGADSSLSGENVAFGEGLLRHVRNIKEQAGIDSLKFTRALPGGGYVVAYSMGGIDKVLYYVEDEGGAEESVEEFAPLTVPLLYSGRVTRGRYRPDRGELPSLWVTPLTCRRLTSYVGAGGASRFDSEQFDVPPGAQFPEFNPDSDSPMVATQYWLHRPGWYSGAMAQVMQVVAGYGKQGEDYPRLTIPEEVMRAINLELSQPDKRLADVQIVSLSDEEQSAERIRLPGYSGVVPEDGTFRYRYRWDNTDGVAFDSARRPWLVKVSHAGVVAMPLPLVVATRTEAFRRWMEDVGDSEVLEVLDRFGGLPSGEGWPLGEARKQWEKAGVIVEVCDTADFYNHLSYSAAVGWSFALNGREGYNTCYSYDEGSGWQVGYGYMLLLGLQAIAYAPWQWPESPFWHEQVRGYITEVFGWLGKSAEAQAVKYKLVRAGFDAVLARLHMANSDPARREKEEPEYWRGLSLGAVATHGGSVKRVSEGILFPENPQAKRQPQIKFPDTTLLACLSHDFTPLPHGKQQNPRCDTIMFGYYVGDALKVVKYFREPRDFTHKVESDFESCMIVGSWTRYETVGQTHTMGAFYTSDFDERDQVSPSEQTTKIVGSDRGQQPADDPAYGFLNWPFQNGSMSRSRFFSHATDVTSIRGRSLQTAICIPLYERNAALHAWQHTHGGGSHSFNTSMDSIKDPNVYGLWTYHWSLRYTVGSPFGGVSNSEFRDKYMTARPVPVDCDIFWLEGENTEEGGACSDFADQGSWRSPIEDVTSLVASTPGSTGDASIGWQPSFSAVSVYESVDAETEERLDCSISEDSGAVGAYVPVMYFLNSPDEFGMLLIVDAGKNHIGDTVYAVVSEAGEEGEYRHWGDSQYAEGHTSIPYFIGVVNE